MNTAFDTVLKQYHGVLQTENKCNILCCGENTEIALIGIESGNKRFYCKRCADELLTTGLFVIELG